MKILGIETSCDETAVAILEATGAYNDAQFKLLGQALYSQVKIHAEYGGVFPNLAKREHAKNLVPLLQKALQDSDLHKKGTQEIPEEKIKEILYREFGLADDLIAFARHTKKPDVDMIAVTAGPGLEPALWVGINFAQALGLIWNIPVLPTNHMEGHIVSPLLQENSKIEFPVLALLISGGHTELVKMQNWAEYELIGQTRDDAVGEAFDKTARLLGLPYPGGPEISKLAALARDMDIKSPFPLPRPMIKSNDYDFSFSGIKTAVLYGVKKIPELTENIKMGIAREFEDAVTEVLVEKVKKALDSQEIKTVILGGGVVANSYIRKSFQTLIDSYSEIKLLIPDIPLSTDNAVMIAMAGYFSHLANKQLPTTITAQGNLKLA